MKRRSTLLPRIFYEQDPPTVARSLLGKLLHRRLGTEVLVGRITEAEAYLGKDDPASHTFGGKTPYNAVLYGPAGYTDVYFIYGMYYCMNFSCLPDGQPGGVLIRALLPIEGLATMAKLRGVAENASPKVIAGGPGRLCKAMAITRATDHDIDVTRRGAAIQVLDDGYSPKGIQVTPRIGITKAVDLPLRFLLKPDGLK